jgi:hypothetical protein
MLSTLLETELLINSLVDKDLEHRFLDFSCPNRAENSSLSTGVWSYHNFHKILTMGLKNLTEMKWSLVTCLGVGP